MRFHVASISVFAISRSTKCFLARASKYFCDKLTNFTVITFFFANVLVHKIVEAFLQRHHHQQIIDIEFHLVDQRTRQTSKIYGAGAAWNSLGRKVYFSLRIPSTRTINWLGLVEWEEFLSLYRGWKSTMLQFQAVAQAEQFFAKISSHKILLLSELFRVFSLQSW